MYRYMHERLHNSCHSQMEQYEAKIESGYTTPLILSATHHSIVCLATDKHNFLFLGVVALVRHLHSHGIPIAVATSSSSKSYNDKISKKLDLFSLFSHFVCSDDKEMKHGKPAPDIYLIAASRFSNPPQSNANVSIYVSIMPTNWTASITTATGTFVNCGKCSTHNS